MALPVIEIRDAVVSYREEVALKGVSLSVAEGELVAVIGPNGAGKTTLLTVVNGLGRLLSGEVRVLGERLSPRNAHRLRTRVGYVAQREPIDPRMPLSAGEVAMMGRSGRLGLLRRPGQADREVVEKTLRLVGMEHLGNRPIGHLSGGQQQRVAIARALSQEPAILLLDEPTANLDRRAQRELLNLIQEIHHQGHLTTLFVSHELNALPQGCHRVVMMKEGYIWREGRPQEVLKEDILSQLYDVPISVVQHGEREFIIS